MSSQNNNKENTLFKLFILPAIMITLLYLLVSSGYLYYKDQAGFNEWLTSVKQQRVEQLRQIKHNVANISQCLHKSKAYENGAYALSLPLVREFLDEKPYCTTIAAASGSSFYAGVVDEYNWIELGSPRINDGALLAIKIPPQYAEYSSLYHYTVSGNALDMSGYQLFELYQTNYDITKQLNWLMLVWLLWYCLAAGIISGVIIMYARRCKQLQTALQDLPALKHSLQQYQAKEAQMQQQLESIMLWYKAHVYELQSVFDGVKQMGGVLSSLWQVLHVHFNDLEPQYKKFMDEVYDIVDNLAHGFILPPRDEQELSVDECLRKIFDGKQEELRLGKLQLEFNAPEDPVLLACFPAALKQVLHGLVNYAIRLTPEDCTVKVRFYKDSLEIEHFGFVIESSDYSYRNSFLSLSLTSLSYLCKKHNWSLIHNLSGPKGSQGGVFLLRFNRKSRPAIKLVHNVSKIKE